MTATAEPRRVLKTDADIVEALGGAIELNRRLGFPKDSRVAHNWVSRGIAANWRPKIKEIASIDGFDVPDDFLDPRFR